MIPRPGQTNKVSRGRSGDELQDYSYNLTNPRRRSNMTKDARSRYTLSRHAIQYPIYGSRRVMQGQAPVVVHRSVLGIQRDGFSKITIQTHISSPIITLRHIKRQGCAFTCIGPGSQVDTDKS